MPHRAAEPREEIVLRTERFNVIELTTTLKTGAPFKRHLIRHPGAVVILPLLSSDEIVLIENERPAVGESLLELPAGTREPNEPAIETARRELVEETGYRANSLQPLLQFYMSPGIMNETMESFVATELTLGEPQHEAEESIVVRPVKLQDANEMIRLGEIRDAKTIAVLMYFFGLGGVATDRADWHG